MTYKQIKLGNELYVQAERETGFVTCDGKGKFIEPFGEPILWLGEEFEGVKTEDEIEVVWQFDENLDGNWEECYEPANIYAREDVRQIARLKPIEQKQEQPVQQEAPVDHIPQVEKLVQDAIMEFGLSIAKFPSSQLKERFIEVDFNGHYLIQFENQGGVWIAVNAMDGWGNNCRNEVEGKEGTVYLQSPPTPLKDLSQIEDEDLQEVVKLYRAHYGDINAHTKSVSLKEKEVAFEFYEGDELKCYFFDIDCMPYTCFRYLEKKGYRLNTINQL